MDFRRVIFTAMIDRDEDPCKCQKDPLKCPSDCPYYFPPMEYVPPLPSTVRSSDHHSVLSTTPVIIIIVLCSLFLLLTYYAMISKFCIAWRRRSRAPSARHEREEGEGDEMMEPPVNYVWYINTVGLEQSVINAITICKYKKGDGLVEGTDCSVCLSEFLDDEDVRLLPNCSHAFHVSCIDIWLRSHVNCPLCRAHIVPNPEISSAQNLQVPNDNPILENAQNISSLDVVGDGQKLENKLKSELEREDVRMMNVKNLDGGSSSGIIAGTDLAGSFRADEYVLDVGATEEVQPVRRSVSMDSSAASKIYSSFVAARQVTEQEGGNKKGSVSERSFLKIVGNGARGSLFLNRPVPMKRSYSNSGSFVSKKHSKNRSSVLPL